MASPFVPFLPASPRPSSGGSRLKLISPPSTQGSPGLFTPLSTSSPMPQGAANTPQPHAHVHHPHTTPDPELPPAPPPPPPRSPVITLHRQGDRIVGIRVECSCGEVMELTCQY